MRAPPLWLALAGLALPPALWSLNNQLGQILPYAECGLSWRPGAWLSALFTALSLGGAWLAWRGAGQRTGSTALLLRLGAGLGLMLALALLLQGLSALLLTGCER